MKQIAARLLEFFATAGAVAFYFLLFFLSV